MKKFNTLAILLATVGFATIAGAQTIDNWKNGTGELVWKNGTGEHCWRDANWTPATAAPECEPALVKPTAMVVPTPMPESMAATPMPVPVPMQTPVASKVTFSADAFFDFDKSVLKPEGKMRLNNILGQVKTMDLEVIIAVGHTDSVGSDSYNQKLSMRRSESVKAYLVSNGIDANRVYTEGKGEMQPIADNKTASGRAQNRRVEIEVVGRK